MHVYTYIHMYMYKSIIEKTQFNYFILLFPGL